MKKTKSILVVEDDLAIQNVIRLLLDLEGYIVFVANDYPEAIGKLTALKDEHKPCLVLTDIMMPHDGHNLIAAIKADDILVSIPVVAMSAAASTEKVRLMKKPFSVDDLLETVKKYCEIKT